MKLHIFWLMCLMLITTLAAAQITNPQKMLEGKLTRKTNQAIDKKTDQAIDSLLNDKTKPADNHQNSETKQVQVTQADTAVAVMQKNEPALQTYSKFDFVAGEKVIFYDDFSQGNVGDFPVLWNTNGSAEIVTSNLFPGKWMQVVSRNAVWTDGLLNLPENYTIEFDIIPIKGEDAGMAGYHFRLLQSVNEKSFDPGSVPGKAGFQFQCEYFGRPGYRTYINGNEGQGLALNGTKEDKNLYEKINQKYHISIWVQKARVRLYQNETKLFDLPKAFPVSTVKMDRIRFEDGAALISNVRIAIGTPDMRSKLLTEGKLVSYGIYFDLNKDVLKPESYGTLKSIADVLTENPSVRIKIVGHTDADGNAADNLDLSKRRAEAVKNELSKSFSIATSRMEIDGKGATQPVAPNDNSTNKALNRRVEFIKL